MNTEVAAPGAGVQLPAPLAGEGADARAAVLERGLDLGGELTPQVARPRGGQRADRQPAAGQGDVDGLQPAVGGGLDRHVAAGGDDHPDRPEVDQTRLVGHVGGRVSAS
jgi:hypothetical protein